MKSREIALEELEYNYSEFKKHFTMITTKDGLKIEMVELLDDLGDSPDWGEWTCNVLLPDGKWLENCCVQGDEHDIARETLTDEDGKEL